MSAPAERVDVLAALSSDTGGMSGADLLIKAQELATAKALAALLYHFGKATYEEADADYQLAHSEFEAKLYSIRTAVAELIEAVKLAVSEEGMTQDELTRLRAALASIGGDV